MNVNNNRSGRSFWDSGKTIKRTKQQEEAWQKKKEQFGQIIAEQFGGSIFTIMSDKNK